MDELKANYKREHIIFKRNLHIQKQRVILSNYTKKFDNDCYIIGKKYTQNNIIIPNSVKHINHNTINNKYFNFEITNNLKCYYINPNNKIKFEFSVGRNSLRKTHCYDNILHLINHNCLLFGNRNKYFRNIFLLENICNFSIYYYNTCYKYYNDISDKINVCSNKKIIIFKNSHMARFVKCLYDVKNLAILRNIYDVCFNIDGNKNIYALCNVYIIRNEWSYIIAKIIKPLKMNALQIYDIERNKLKYNLMYVAKLIIAKYESKTATKTIKNIYICKCV